MPATERIPLLVTPAQKALFAKKAKASKLSVNEFVRRAAEVYKPSDDEALLRLVAQVRQTTQEASAALDAALKILCSVSVTHCRYGGGAPATTINVRAPLKSCLVLRKINPERVKSILPASPAIAQTLAAAAT